LHRGASQGQQTLVFVATHKKRVGPFLKWAGGKGHLLRQILPFVPEEISHYHEPFLGGGALFFAARGKSAKFKAFLSDVNSELINAYMIVKKEPTELLHYLVRLQKQFLASNREKYYYEIRKWEPTASVESAARFIFLNKTCYNGLYRVNSQGHFNVPFSRSKKPGIFNEDNIRSVSQALNDCDAQLNVIDYKEAIANCRKGDFVYLDPPYDPSTKTSGFTDYTVDGFTDVDHRELAELFAKLSDRGCLVLLSNSDTPLTRKLYRNYWFSSIEVNRPISCNGKKRRGFRELIVASHSPNGDVKVAPYP